MNPGNRHQAPTAVAEGELPEATEAELGAPEVSGAAETELDLTHRRPKVTGKAGSSALAVSDVFYLIDMDSEGLCLHHLHQN